MRSWLPLVITLVVITAALGVIVRIMGRDEAKVEVTPSGDQSDTVTDSVASGKSLTHGPSRRTTPVKSTPASAPPTSLDPFEDSTVQDRPLIAAGVVVEQTSGRPLALTPKVMKTFISSGSNGPFPVEIADLWVSPPRLDGRFHIRGRVPLLTRNEVLVLVASSENQGSLPLRFETGDSNLRLEVISFGEIRARVDAEDTFVRTMGRNAFAIIETSSGGRGARTDRPIGTISTPALRATRLLPGSYRFLVRHGMTEIYSSSEIRIAAGEVVDLGLIPLDTAHFNRFEVMITLPEGVPPEKVRLRAFDIKSRNQGFIPYHRSSKSWICLSTADSVRFSLKAPGCVAKRGILRPGRDRLFLEPKFRTLLLIRKIPELPEGFRWQLRVIDKNRGFSLQSAAVLGIDGRATLLTENSGKHELQIEIKTRDGRSPSVKRGIYPVPLGEIELRNQEVQEIELEVTPKQREVLADQIKRIESVGTPAKDDQ
jgi:hypothetical protein